MIVSLGTRRLRPKVRRGNFWSETVFLVLSTYVFAVFFELKRAVYVLRMAYIYARRVDWLLAGDDGEDSFVERLQMELSELKAKYPSGHFTYKARMVKFDDEFSQYKVVDDD